MAYKLDWLADVTHTAGLNVSEVAGWRMRGHGDFAVPLGVLLHHTAGPRVGDMPSLGTVTNGRPGLKGPLCNLALSRSGVVYVVAAGEAWHAGEGRWPGIGDGNTHLIGIEAENTGLSNDKPWPEVQIKAYVKLCAALVRHAHIKLVNVIGHKEWAPDRKPDPTFDMNVFRAALKVELGSSEPVVPTPAEHYVVARVMPGDTLSLRDSPDGKKIGGMPNGTLLTVVGPPHGKWYHVRTPYGVEGWSWSDYLDIISVTVGQAGQSSIVQGEGENGT